MFRLVTSGPVSYPHAALILPSVCSIWPKFSNGDNNRGRPGERRRWVLPVDRVSCMLLQASPLHLPPFPSVHPHSEPLCLSPVTRRTAQPCREPIRMSLFLTLYHLLLKWLHNPCVLKPTVRSQQLKRSQVKLVWLNNAAYYRLLWLHNRLWVLLTSMLLPSNSGIAAHSETCRLLNNAS